MKFAERVKTHFMFNNIFFFRKSFRLWDNVDIYCRAGQATVDKRVACWIPKAINTHCDYVILIAFLPQQRLHVHASLSPYTYIAYIVECYAWWVHKISTGLWRVKWRHRDTESTSRTA